MEIKQFVFHGVQSDTIRHRRLRIQILKKQKTEVTKSQYTGTKEHI